MCLCVCGSGSLPPGRAAQLTTAPPSLSLSPASSPPNSAHSSALTAAQQLRFSRCSLASVGTGSVLLTHRLLTGILIGFSFFSFFFLSCFFGAWMDSASDPGRSGSDPPVTETPSSLETLRGEEHLTPARRHSSSGSSSSGSGYSKGKSSGLCATSNTHFHLHTHTQDTREPRGTFTQQPRRLRFVTPRTVTSSWAKRERAAAPLEEFEQCSECDGCDSEGCWFDSSEGEPETSPQTV